MTAAEPHRPAHRFAVAFGVIAAAVPWVWLLPLFVDAQPDPLSPGVAVQAGMLLASLPLLVLPVVGVALALRSGWHRTAGLVLLAVGGVLGLSGLGLLGAVVTFAGDPRLLLSAVGVVAALAAGAAALLALRGRGPLPLQRRTGDPLAVRGWPALAAVAALALALLRGAELVGLLTRGTLLSAPLLSAGALATALVWAGLAVAALRLVDGRLLALVLALPGAWALAEAVGAAVQVVQVRQVLPGAAGVEPLPGTGLSVLPLAAFALAAAMLWWRHRPLAAAPAAVPDLPRPAQR